MVRARALRSSQRDALVDAAFQALALDGPEFRLDAVAQRAGASKALVFHHFGTREGLFDAMAARVLSETQDGLARLVDEHPSPRQRLLALAETLLEEPLDTAPAASRHVLQFWLSGAPPRGALRDALLRDFVGATVKEGHMRPASDVASLMLARWHGASILYATEQVVDFDAERRRLRTDLERLIS